MRFRSTTSRLAGLVLATLIGASAAQAQETKLKFQLDWRFEGPAALFLADFVPDSLPWLHLDLFAWNDTPRPGRPVGGEAQTLRTLLRYLESRFGG